MKNIWIWLFLGAILCSQEIVTIEYTEQDSIVDRFAYQLPENYDSTAIHPLLVVWHQWNGSELSCFNTEFDEECFTRGWIMMSHYGGWGNHYNNQITQSYVESELLWMIEYFSVDPTKIYMVGGSMGGASGAIYANNHLNPMFPMVAATASASGILDCERRYWEMDGNNSMIEHFGGTPIEVGFEYHRNSAVFFADTVQSMHFNLLHIPIYLDFANGEPHQFHAEDMFELMNDFHSNIWIETEPTGGHGFACFDEAEVCDWLSQFSLLSDPDFVTVNLDEPSRAYWFEVVEQSETHGPTFTRFIGRRDLNHYSIFLQNNLRTGRIYLDSMQDTIHLEILNIDAPITYLLHEFPFCKIGCEINSGNVNAIEWIDNELLISVDNPIDLLIYNQFGDVNLDMEINILDITKILQFILELEVSTDHEFCASDANNDAIINLLDILIIVSWILSNN